MNRPNVLSVSVPRLCVSLLVTLVLAVSVVNGTAWADGSTGDHQWNIRENGDDRFHSNESWLRPWRYDYDDGWGRWVGNYTYEVHWGSVSKTGSADGSLSIGRGQDHQWHVWTYVYVEETRTITLSGSGDCVPRAFLNYDFNNDMTFAPTFNLNAGWNRIDLTGYNQNSGYTFTCGALADLVDVMNSEETNAPEPNAGGGYDQPEGTPIEFDAGGSTDADGDPLQYRWDFDTDGTYDTGWSSSPTATHTWYDDWNGEATVEVSDGTFERTASAPVTVHNVDPTVSLDGIDHPHPRFIFTTHTVTFRGSFTDPGCADIHTYTWDFGDGEIAEGNCSEEHDPPDATGEAVVRYSYSEAGIYSVSVTISDDDGGSATSEAVAIRVLKAKPGTRERQDR